MPPRLLTIARSGIVASVTALLAFSGCAGPEPFHLDAATRATPETLTVGDSAPPLYIRTWVMGGDEGAIQIGATGKVTLVSFFATWCAPCRAVAPRLEQLHRDMGDTVDVVEVVTLDAVCTESQVRLYVRENPWITMRVAIDDGVKTASAYRAAAREDAIPRAFIIDRDARIAWIGHPADARPVLERVLDGSWSIPAAREARTRRMDALRRAEAIFAELRDSEDKSRTATIDRYQRLVALEPGLEGSTAPTFQHWALAQALAAEGRADESLASARRSLGFERVRHDPLAWLTLANAIAQADPDLAQQWADEGWRRHQAACQPPMEHPDAWDIFMAIAAREDPQPHVSMAEFRARQGRNSDAAAHMKDAMACIAHIPEFAAYRAELEKTLKGYEAAQ